MKPLMSYLVKNGFSIGDSEFKKCIHNKHRKIQINFDEVETGDNFVTVQIEDRIRKVKFVFENPSKCKEIIDIIEEFANKE